jgi:hypothetical protein
VDLAPVIAATEVGGWSFILFVAMAVVTFIVMLITRAR